MAGLSTTRDDLKLIRYYTDIAKLRWDFFRQNWANQKFNLAHWDEGTRLYKERTFITRLGHTLAVITKVLNL